MKIDITKPGAIAKALKDVPVRKPIDITDTAVKGLNARVRRMPEGHIVGTWAVRVMIDGKSRRVSLGNMIAMNASQARVAAIQAREAAKGGQTIKSHREATQAARVAAQATAAVAEKAATLLYQLLFDNSDPDRKSWSAAHWDGLKNGDVYARQVELLMSDDIHLPASALTPEIMEQVFLRKSDTAPHGATRAMSYLRPALNYFAKRRQCAYNLLDLASDHKTKTVRRERVLTPDEWVCIWKAAGTVMFNMGPTGLAIRTLMMTGARNREVAAMRVDELHLDRYEWHLPKDRSKNEEPHIFCLPAKAVEQIKQALVMKEHHNIPGPWVFSKEGKAPVMIGSKIKTGMDCRSGVKDWVFHDLRRTFATQLAERGFSGEIVDMCLNHKASASRGGVAGVYNRSVRLEDRHNAANGWQNITNNWLDETTSNDNVVRLTS